MEVERSFLWGLYRTWKRNEERDAKVTWSDFFPTWSPSKSGYTVNEDTASTLSAVYRAVNIWGDTLNVPIYHYRKTNEGKESITDSLVYKVLHNKPNRVMSPTMFFQTMEASRFFYGNGYAFIKRNVFGEPLELVWVHPDCVKLKNDPDILGAPLFYDIENNNGETILKDVSSQNVIHVRTLSYDGLLGKPIIELAAESMGGSLAAQDFASTFFKNGSRSDGVLEHPGSLKEDSYKRLKQSFDENRRAGGTMVLEQGMKYNNITIPPEQAQFLETRKMGIDEISRWSGVPKFMLAEGDPTYSNVEHFALSFITHNVRPRARMYEQEFNYKLLTADNEFVKFDLRGLLRADAATRSQLYTQAIQNGWMNRDEVRDLEGFNNIPEGEGKEFLTPMNLVTDKQREDDGQGETI